MVSITKSYTKKQLIDSGMALVLIMLLIGFFSKNNIFYKISIPLLLINMILPKFFYPFAIVWYTITNILGGFVSKIILSLIYFILVFPVGLIRNLIGKDSLGLRNFKKNKSSSLKNRNKKFSFADLEKPY
jgi:hypothetical protein